MTIFATGIRQPPGLRAMPRTWKKKPARQSSSVATEVQRSTVRAAHLLKKPQMPAPVIAPLSTTGVHMTSWP